ncbi:argininosuccinate lyase [Cerasicoccus arenae]|uniref:Argininosuccinate lyase n=1 Tax=Cerasicoccus arenae TaxID=424488 RepID=A0A8J3DB61_9BACT|nr:argininosuccinate lyase [Cerasicoccus arenae]MBK1859129.1 argininosuccinate lyase [Cerasicoccus arenae]GHB98008.1 argininosuccinate lyase [Cerasicoccus arenae]
MAKPGKQATWGGRFSSGPAELMQRFSESVSFDARLAPFDVQGSKAHAAMLAHVGILTAKECSAIQKGLDTVLKDIQAGNFTWDITCEDVHMNIEQELTRRVPAAAKLHTARSRNDQVATDMRLFFKHACAEIDTALGMALSALLTLAEASQEIYLPGYTHLQRAQPVSAAHHLLAYIEMFVRDRERFAQIADRANWCPLGSGAIAGTTLPIDREFTALQLGFVDKKGKPRVTRNSMDAVADRDLFIEFASACALCGVHWSRVAEDVILWNSAEFGFIKLPDSFTTGSSLMPQKKNPDSFELLRGKAARLQGHVTALMAMTKGLPLTYNRDLQEDKPPVFDAFDQTMICLAVLAGSFDGAAFNEEKCAAAVSDPALLATDLVDYLVVRGVAFRDAHHIIGALVGLSEKKKLPLNELSLADVQGVSDKFAADWVDVFNVPAALKKREKTGMPGPRQVKKQLAKWKASLRLDR